VEEGTGVDMAAGLVAGFVSVPAGIAAGLPAQPASRIIKPRRESKRRKL
jgi:hypothetical protein